MLFRDTIEPLLAATGAHQPPIDPAAVARHLGLEVRLVYCLPDEVGGALDRRRRLILINARHPTTRRRFSLAHELGEWLLESVEHAEVDRFAAALLMPAHLVDFHCTRKWQAEWVARRFGVSRAVARKRMEELGYGTIRHQPTAG